VISLPPDPAPSIRRQFVKDGAIYGGATLLTGVSNVALVSIYTRALDRTAYGVVEYVAVLQLLIQIVFGLELTQGIARYFGGSDDGLDRRAYASTGFCTLLISYGAACGALFLVADLVEAALFAGTAAGVLRPATVAIYLGIVFYVVRSQLRWELRSVSYAAASVTAVVVSFAVSAYVLVVAVSGLVGVFIGLATGYGAGVAVCLWELRGTYHWSLDVAKLVRMLRFSAPLTISTLALLAASYGDRFVVRAGMGFADLGVYAAGAKIASVIALASAGFQLGAAPLIYRHYRAPDTPDALAQLLRMFVALGLVGVLGLAAFAIELLAIFTGPAYHDGWRVIPLLSLSTVLGSAYVFLPGLTIREMTVRFAMINVTAAGVSLLATIVLAQTYGIVGAATGVCIGAAAAFAMHGTFSQRVYALPMHWGRVVGAIAIAVAAIVAAGQLGETGLGYVAARAALCGVAAAVALAVLLTRSDRAMLMRLLMRADRAATRSST
jgi:O-antigen/teichoic acid export membrane protein